MDNIYVELKDNTWGISKSNYDAFIKIFSN